MAGEIRPTSGARAARTGFGMDELRRRQDGRVIAGVAAGLSDRLGIDVALVRIGFVVASLLSSGLGVIAYLILWAVVPEDDSVDDVLAARLESGEITADEYGEIIADIEASSPGRRRR